MYEILKQEKLTHSDRKPISGCLRLGGGKWGTGGSGLTVKRHEENLGVIHIFYILIVMVVTWVYIYLLKYIKHTFEISVFIICKFFKH